MKKLWVVALVLLGIYGCYRIAMPSATVRYRLALTVDDNGKEVKGSGVIQVYRQDTTKVFGSSFGGFGYAVKGEAVTVDLGEKGVLFALLKRGYSSNSEPPYVIFKAFEKSYLKDPNSYIIDYMNSLNRDRPKADLNFDLLPMLVRFRDINDPKTVEQVFPDELDKAFGPGVKLLSATIEITRDSVTTGIDKWLPWISKFYDQRLDGDRYGSSGAKNRIANDLSSGAFSTELSPYAR